MAMNVFGTPITKATLAAMPQYMGKEITQTDKAGVALNMKNANMKDASVLQFVENVGRASGYDITTLIVIYNATGDTLTYAGHHDWHGQLGDSPWPITIANGQWAGLVHVNSACSRGAVVYHGKNESGKECDWMAAWRNENARRIYDERPVHKVAQVASFFNPILFPSIDYMLRPKVKDINTVYTEARQKDHFQGPTWDYVLKNHDETSEAVNTSHYGGCTSTISTGSGPKAVVEAIFSLENANYY